MFPHEMEAQRQAAIETAWMRLLGVTPDSLREFARAEVVRREDVFAKISATTERGGVDPKLSAIESVVSDIASGRI